MALEFIYIVCFLPGQHLLDRNVANQAAYGKIN